MANDFFTVESAQEVLEKYKDEISNHKKYRILYSKTFTDFWNSRINKEIFFTIYFKVDILDDLSIKEINDKMVNLNPILLNNNFIEIDKAGNVLTSYNKVFNNQHDMKEELKELSKANCVFFFGKSGIDKFVNGESLNDINIFYTQADLKKYSEKRHISELPQVIEEYATKYIPQQCQYMSFFAENALLNRIDANLIRRNILRNSPEKYMRDHLLGYLNEHMQHTFVKEPELIQSKRELDIYTEDSDSSLIFIEIKWLGTSVDKTGTKLGQEYKEDRARSGVKQVLEYIKELCATPGASLKCGYLAVYDARDEDLTIDYGDYSTYIDQELIPYLQLFGTLPTIPLRKTHPA